MTIPPTTVVYAELASLRQSIDRALAGNEISYTGWGMADTMGQIREMGGLRERLCGLRPDLYGHLPERMFGTSIASQKTALREVRREIDHLIAIGVAAGLCSPLPPSPLATEALGVSEVLARLNPRHNHLSQLVIAVVAGFLIWFFGWS